MERQITGTVGYSNDVFNWGETGIYYNLSGVCELPAEFKFNWSAGYYSLHDAPMATVLLDDMGNAFTVVSHEDEGYFDYSLGVSRTYKHLDFGLSYVGTGGDAEDLFGYLADDRVIASVKFNF